VSRKVSPLNDEQIVSLYQSGISSTKIGKLANLNFATILKRLRKRNVEIRSSAAPRKCDYSKVVLDYKSGMRLPELSRVYRVSMGTIGRIVKLSKVEKHPALRGKEHPCWKGGTKDVHGYRIVSGEKEHRIVGARLIGRPLHVWETAHHVDANRDDNSDSNIVVIPEREHMRFHMFLRSRNLVINRENLENICRKEGEFYYRFTVFDYRKASFAFPGTVKRRLPVNHCRIRGCSSKVNSYRLCSKHYQRKLAKERGYWLSGKGKQTIYRDGAGPNKHFRKAWTRNCNLTT